jgi:hypothetical protein
MMIDKPRLANANMSITLAVHNGLADERCACAAGHESHGSFLRGVPRIPVHGRQLSGAVPHFYSHVSVCRARRRSDNLIIISWS